MLDETVDTLGLVTTFSGRVVNVKNPSPDMFAIEDIALSLSNLCRYVGHVKPFYSVAEHCFLVSLNCGDDPIDQLWGLLHDAPESVLGDLSSTIKHLPELTAFRLMERRIMASICLRFGLPVHEPGIVKTVDTAIRVNEQMKLRGIRSGSDRAALPATIHGWAPARAESMFLKQFHALSADLKKLAACTSVESQES